MLSQEEIFLFYLTATNSGLCWYLDNNRNAQTAPISAGSTQDLSIPIPDGWLQAELSFARNMTYLGLNRSFSMPQRLVKDAAFLAREIFYKTGKGIESPLTMVILKYNDAPGIGEPTYQLYYKGALDLPNWDDDVAEGAQCNLMEGGAMRFLKAIENLEISIPCDGSIPENIKANFDGMRVPDKLHYQFAPMQLVNAGVMTAATIFLDSDGDNFGTQHGDQQYEQPTGIPYFQNSQNFNLSFQLPTTVRITGSITVRPLNAANPRGFYLYLQTSLSLPVGLAGLTHAQSLVPGNQDQYNIGKAVTVYQQSVYNFDVTVNLAANENLFFLTFNNDSAAPITIVAGSFDLEFNSMAPATTAWGMTLYDLIKKLIETGNQILSTTFDPVSVGFDSQLLKNNLNYFITSGDALRASGDPNYQKFYNAIQNNPNFPNINETYSYGPVIKTTLRDAVESARVQLMSALGNQQLPGENETIFVEYLQYVFNSTSGDTFDLGEVSGLKVSVFKEWMYNILHIGYAPQSYDQKSGKYEWNTTAIYQLPFKSFTGKILKLICPFRADAWGIEKLRSNITATSTTRNDSDNSVFIVNIDYSKFIYDYYLAKFDSGVKDPVNANNTNLLLIHKKAQQPLQFPSITGGGYFTEGTDPSIFVLNQASLVAVSKPISLTLAGTLIGNPANLLTGLPADTVTFTLYANGIVLNTWTFSSTTAVTAWNISWTLTQNWNYRDCIYLSMATSVNGTANVTSGHLDLGVAGAYFSALIVGIVTADPGTGQKLVAFPAVTALLDPNNLEVVSYGFQYFLFNSLVINSNFTANYGINGFINGTSGQQGATDLYLNGQLQTTSAFVSAGHQDPFTLTFEFNRTFQFGDLLFATVSAQDLNVWVTTASLILTSTFIKAWSLKRVKYDLLYGVPNLAFDSNGNPDSSLPGAPYNIEDLTPGRLLRKWFPFLKGILFDQAPGTMYFSTLSKNKYLATTVNGVTIAEAANIEIGDMGEPLFIPRTFKCRLITPHTFAQVLTGTSNAHIGFTYGGVPGFGFGMQMKQRPALYEAQEWEMLCSPKTDLSQFVDLNITGLNFLDMPPNSIFASFLSPVQNLPSGQTLLAKYHTYNRNQFWFSQQIGNWINQNNYWQPVQNTDPVPLQYITYGLSPVVVQVWSCGGGLISTMTLTDKTASTNAMPPNYYLWEGVLDMSALAPGQYFLLVIAGASGSTATIVTEGLNVAPDWPETMLFSYKHSMNKQSMVFDTGFTGSFRTWGMFDNMFRQKYTGAFYKDQAQNITILNAIPYETTKLWIGMQDGVPDWVMQKMRVLLLDGCTIEGEGFTLNDGAEWEETRVDGNPKKFHSIEIRPTKNLSGITVTATGITDDTSMMITVDANAFAPNVNNSSQSTEPDIISIIKV